MKKFGDFFGRYISVRSFPENVREGIISSLLIDSYKRWLTAEVSFPSLVKYDVLYGVEDSIKSCPALNLSSACLRPSFPSECFSLEYYGSLVNEIKRREASVNGSLKDSLPEVKDNAEARRR